MSTKASTYKVLVIEDNDHILDNLEELLELAGYNVIKAENGAKGIEKAMSDNPDLIISDITMPVKNGYAVFETLRPMLKEKKIPFIFLTASAQEKDIAKGKSSGANAYLVKPFQPDALLQTISDLLN